MDEVEEWPTSPFGDTPAMEVVVETTESTVYGFQEGFDETYPFTISSDDNEDSLDPSLYSMDANELLESLIQASPPTELESPSTSGYHANEFQEGFSLYGNDTGDDETYPIITSLEHLEQYLGANDLLDTLKPASSHAELASPSTSGYHGPSSDGLPDQALQPRPQPPSDSKSVHEIMTSQKLPLSKIQLFNNCPMDRYSLKKFSNDAPVVHCNKTDSGEKLIMDKNSTEKTLSEINYNPVDDPEPVQDSTNSVSSEKNNGLPLEEESMPLSFSPYFIGEDLLGFQPGLSQLNVVDYLTPHLKAAGKYEVNIPIEVNNSPTNVYTDPPMTTVPQKQQTKKKGGARKQQAVPFDEQQNIDQYCQLVPDLPERTCKLGTIKKNRKLLSEETELDRGHSSAEKSEGPKKKAKRVAKGVKPEEEVTRNPDTLSPASQSDVSSEDVDQEKRAKRNKNNVASKNSREKRKKLDKMVEKDCVALQERNKRLCSMVVKLQRARDIVTSVVLGNFAQANSVA